MSLMNEREQRRWTLLTNHGAILVYIARHPDATVREIAEAVDVTERAAARIIAQLREAGYVAATRSGRRNSYTLASDLPMRHVAFRGLTIEHFLRALADGSEGVHRG